MSTARLDLDQYRQPANSAGVVVYDIPATAPVHHGSPALLQLVHDFLGRYEAWAHRALSFETSITQQPNITRARVDVATHDGHRARLLLPLTNSDSTMHANVKEVGELYQVVLRGRDNPPAQQRHLADYASPNPKWTYLLRRDETTAVKRRILQEFLSAHGVYRVSYRCTRDPEAPGYLVVDAFAPAGNASLLIHLAPEHHEQLQELEALVQGHSIQG